MFRFNVLITALLFMGLVTRTVSLQCYKCGCFVNPGQTTCTEESELNCVIQYVENSYCYILRNDGDIEFGHNLNSDLLFLESLHYIRATEKYTYSNVTSTWGRPQVIQVSYGCDWNLCNTPKILNLLPSGLAFDVSTALLTNLFIDPPTATLTSCLSCAQCVNSTAAVNCPPVPCSGTCFINDHIDDPGFNDGTCAIVFESSCPTTTRLETTVEIKGNYYIDDKIPDITEIDVYCSKDNCNSITNVQAIQRNTTISTQLNNQLFFRPSVVATTPSTPNGQLLECYVCYCQRRLNTDDCQVLNCTTVFRNESYCEIVRDFTESSDLELITLGHIPKASLRYPHYISAVEELELSSTTTWSSPSVSFITYVCDWPLCNDPRIVDKLISSFQFSVDPSEIAQYIQGSNPVSSCLECRLCTNNSADLDKCQPKSCAADSYCFIEEYIDDPQYNDCEYAFQADCQQGVRGSNMIIGAVYDIDSGKLDIDQFDLYCSLNDCNSVQTVMKLRSLLLEDIRLDPLFFLRPVVSSTMMTSASTTATEPTGSGAVNSISFVSYFLIAFAFWI